MNEELTPDEMEQLKLALKQAMKYVLDNGEKIVARADKSPPDQVAISVIVTLMTLIHSTAKDAGVTMRMEVLLAAAVHVIRALVELFIMAGVIKESEAKTFAAKVTQGAIQMHNGSK